MPAEKSPPTAAAGRTGARRRTARRTISSIVGVFVLILVSLQLFLLMVSLDAVTTDAHGMAWASAVASAALATCAAFLYSYLRRSHRR